MQPLQSGALQLLEAHCENRMPIWGGGGEEQLHTIIYPPITLLQVIRGFYEPIYGPVLFGSLAGIVITSQCWFWFSQPALKFGTRF
jgi:hypothetical protein